MSDRHISASGGSDNSHGAVYDGTYFLSRTAAQWAAFFDRINWDWRYRPVLRNGWTPDFALGRDVERAVPCIVLPIDLGNVDRDQMQDVLEPSRDRIGRAQDAVGGGYFLVLGSRPFGDFEGGMSSVGWFMSAPWRPQNLGTTCLSVDRNSGQLDFVVGGPPYRGAVTGRSYDHSNGRIGAFIAFCDEIWPIWRSAVEAVKGGAA